MKLVIQEWLGELPMMQQTVLLTTIRGPDNMPKYNSTKMLLRWYRRCVLYSAMDGRALNDPLDPSGSFTGPSFAAESMSQGQSITSRLDELVDYYVQEADLLPHHFQMHFMHAVEILGYHHPDDNVRKWWHSVYLRLVHSMHLHPESIEELDSRLGDTRSGWLARADRATVD